MHFLKKMHVVIARCLRTKFLGSFQVLKFEKKFQIERQTTIMSLVVISPQLFGLKDHCLLPRWLGKSTKKLVKAPNLVFWLICPTITCTYFHFIQSFGVQDIIFWNLQHPLLVEEIVACRITIACFTIPLKQKQKPYYWHLLFQILQCTTGSEICQ